MDIYITNKYFTTSSLLRKLYLGLSRAPLTRGMATDGERVLDEASVGVGMRHFCSSYPVTTVECSRLRPQNKRVGGRLMINT